MPVPVLIVRAQGEFLYANRAAYRYLGLAEAAAPLRLTQWLPEGLGVTLADHWEALLQGRLAEASDRLAIPGGTFIEVRSQRIDWAGQSAVQVTLMTHTAPVLPHEPLYRQMFDTNPAVKLLLDPETGRIVDANASAAAFYGYPVAVIRQMNIAEINCLSPAEIRERMARAEACQQLFFEFRHRTACGEKRDVHVYSGPVRVDGRQYLHSIVVDVTHEKRYYAQLENYHELFQNLPVGVYRSTSGRKARFITVNPAMERIFEADSRQALLETDLAALYDCPEQRKFFSHDIQRDAGVTRRPLRLRSLKGHLIHAEVTVRRQIDPDGTKTFNGIIEDVTARNAAQATQDRLIHLLDASPDIVSIADAGRRMVYLNRAGRDMLGELPESLPEAMAVAHPEWARRRIEEEGIPYALAHGHWYAETALRSGAGEVPISHLIVVRRRENGELDSIATIMRDISESKRYQHELEHLAGHDPLTGAVNRNRFLELLKGERQRVRRTPSPLSLVMFDVDHFKRVNDTYGHSVGDDVLRHLVALCREILREVDVLARWGGEEFMLLLPDTALDGAVALAERLRVAIERKDFAPVPSLTSSFGVAELAPDEPEERCYKRLDGALYRAKGAGRNQVCSAERPVDG